MLVSPDREYTSSIFMGGTNTLVIHNTCEDSLLASPLMIDLVLLTELMTRVKYQREGVPRHCFDAAETGASTFSTPPFIGSLCFVIGSLKSARISQCFSRSV